MGSGIQAGIGGFSELLKSVPFEQLVLLACDQ